MEFVYSEIMSCKTLDFILWCVLFFCRAPIFKYRLVQCCVAVGAHGTSTLDWSVFLCILSDEFRLSKTPRLQGLLVMSLTLFGWLHQFESWRN